ncbi:hypothetical protein FRC08_015697 [Ceratobasidium sp. 394]|nr:hypothetical protein FRC08_015697 [Ceratobasidium sp. 394]
MSNSMNAIWGVLEPLDPTESTAQSRGATASARRPTHFELRPTGNGPPAKRPDNPPPDCSDINRAIDLQRQNLSKYPIGTPGRTNWLASLGISFQRRFERLGKRGDIVEAIYYLSEAVNFTPEGDTRKRLRLESLAVSLFHRFCIARERSQVADIDKAIAFQRRALQLAPDGHADLPRHLYNLGKFLFHRYHRLKELSNLDEAISFLDRAVPAVLDNPDRPGRLQTLSDAYLQRFNHLDDFQALEHAIKNMEFALASTPDDQPDKPQRLKLMSTLLYKRFEFSKDHEDFDRATTCQTQATLLAKSEYDSRTSWLSSLGNSHLSRFEVMGELGDLQRAILYQAQSLSLTPIGHPDRPIHLHNLGNSFRRRFERLGVLLDIDNSITYLSEASSLLPDSCEDSLKCRDNLGNSYMQRFQHLQRPEDIDHAIECHETAVLRTPDDHAAKPRRLESLGNSRVQRFGHSGGREDLNRAVECHSQAVVLTPCEHADKARRLDSLGSSLRQMFEHLTYRMEDINKSIASHEEVVALTPDTHADKPRRLDNLGLAYRQRFERSGDLHDVDMAIKFHEQSTMLTPDDHPDKARRLNNFSCALACRFERLGEPPDIERALEAAKAAAISPTSSPSRRFACARLWAKLCSHVPAASPLDAYREAMNLLPRIVWLGVALDQRQEDVHLCGDIATEAAAAAIDTGHYDLALEWLEEGTSILWGQVLQLRTPLDDLRAVYPELASRLAHVAQLLDGTYPSSSEFSHELEQASQRHHRLAEEWDQLVASARSTPGFENFLRPKQAAELVYAAHSGAVVVINVHSSRCDALIIPPGAQTVSHLPLKSFSRTMAQDVNAQIRRTVFSWQTRAVAYLRTVSQRPAETLSGSLRLIWRNVVEPVLERLGYLEAHPSGELPHVTWRATGPLAFIPLHGAGDYDDAHARTYNYVTSSYTPNLAALLTPSSSGEFRGMLLVGQAQTAGMEGLPGVVQELDNVEQYTRGCPVTRLEGEMATCDAVLQGMEKHSWVHISCHAQQNPVRPMTSGFILHDGRLDIIAVTKQSLGRKGLAFLSACSTAEGNEELPEESIHLASGMLVAGYSTIIASMWSITDQDAPIVADKVYAHLLAAGRPEANKTAKALHLAVESLRLAIGEMEFGRWLPFVHIGL